MIRFTAALILLHSLHSPAFSQEKSPPFRVVPQTGHYSTGTAGVTLSDNGKWLATCSGSDGTARLWEMATHKEVRQFSGHVGPVYTVELSGDGKWLATSGTDRTVRIWDVATGKQHRLFQHTHRVGLVALSGDGKWVVALTSTNGNYNDSAHLWEVATSKEVRVFKLTHKAVRYAEIWTTSARISGDGTRLVTGGRDFNARLWDTSTGKEVSNFRHPDEVWSVALSRDGKHLATGCWDEFARVWEVDTGKEVRTVEARHSSVAISQDGSRFATAGEKLQVWETATGKSIQSFKGDIHRLKPVVLTVTAKLLITGGGSSSFQIWDVNTGKHVFSSAMHADGVATLRGAGRWLITETRDYWQDDSRRWHLWDLAIGKEVRPYWGDTKKSLVLDVSKYGDLLLTRTAGSLHVWSLNTGKLVRTFENSDEHSATLSDDGKAVITHSFDAVTFWDAATGRKTRSVGIDGITGKAVSGDGKWLVISTIKQVAANQIVPQLSLWEVATEKQIRAFARLEAFGSGVLSADGKWLATRSAGAFFDAKDDNSARLWEPATGEVVRSFIGHSARVTFVDMTPDGKWLMTAGQDQTARLWELATGKEVCVCRGHSAEVTSVVLSSDGKRLLTSSWDQTTRVWDSATGKELCRMISFRDGTWAVIDSEGRYDAANKGNINQLQWTKVNQAVRRDEVNDHLYDPELLAKHLGYNKQPMRNLDHEK